MLLHPHTLDDFCNWRLKNYSCAICGYIRNLDTCQITIDISHGNTS